MIVKTATGIRHIATKGLYSGEIAETGEALPSPVKRGRGRPRKDVGPTGAVYNTGALEKILFKMAAKG